MNVTKIIVNSTIFYIGFNEDGLTFVGSPNGDLFEIYHWFTSIEYVESCSQKALIEHELTNYLQGKSSSINLKTNLIGTKFQSSVWQEMSNIAYGKTISYLELARKLNIPTKVRVVARAVARNPLLIIYPCHRVIGSDGRLKGYRGGISFKKRLLDIERQ